MPASQAAVCEADGDDEEDRIAMIPINIIVIITIDIIAIITINIIAMITITINRIAIITIRTGSRTGSSRSEGGGRRFWDPRRCLCA